MGRYQIAGRDLALRSPEVSFLRQIHRAFVGRDTLTELSPKMGSHREWERWRSLSRAEQPLPILALQTVRTWKALHQLHPLEGPSETSDRSGEEPTGRQSSPRPRENQRAAWDSLVATSRDRFQQRLPPHRYTPVTG